MSEPFLAEIRIVGFNFAPRGWALCDGQILPINQNQSLFSLLGTNYGGDGRTTFALPDLRSRVPIHVGQADGGTLHQLGRKGGEETHTLSVTEMPQHMHTVQASSSGADTDTPAGNILAASARMYRNPNGTSLVPMHSNTFLNTGGGQAHENMQPYIVVNFCIALQGLFPSRN